MLLCTYVFMHVSMPLLMYVAYNPSEVIAKYYTYLESHMDADYVALMMLDTHLLSDNDYKAITVAPTDIKMNGFLLQYILQYAKFPADMKKLSKFCDILKGKYSHM